MTAHPTTQRPDMDPMLLSAWLDGELDATQTASVEVWIAEHPVDAELVQGWAADRDTLREQLAPLTQEPLPAAALALLRHKPTGQQAWQQAAMAAGLLLVGGLVGAGLMWQAQAQSQSQGGWAASAPAQSQGSAIDWVHRAAVAHTERKAHG